MKVYALTQSTFALVAISQIFPVTQMLLLSMIYKQMLFFITVRCSYSPFPLLKKYVKTAFFISSLFHVHSSTLKLEITLSFLNCFRHIIGYHYYFWTSSTNNVPFSHYDYCQMEIIEENVDEPKKTSVKWNKQTWLVAENRWYLAMPLVPFIIQRVNVILKTLNCFIL